MAAGGWDKWMPFGQLIPSLFTTPKPNAIKANPSKGGDAKPRVLCLNKDSRVAVYQDATRFERIGFLFGTNELSLRN